eukprot:GEMP01041484.1.p1 GENE.GEMP01041484.1~~GEMP01041484.1.p1  ORF type:complete len:325 (+),score=69.51 GEMP01041484.1:167-1141(+)
MGGCGGKSKKEMAFETAVAEEKYGILLEQQRITQENESRARRENQEILAKCHEMEAQMRRVEARSSLNDETLKRLSTAQTSSPRKQKEPEASQARSAQPAPKDEPLSMHNQLQDTLKQLSKIDTALEAHKEDVDRELPRISRLLDSIDRREISQRACQCQCSANDHVYVPDDIQRYYCTRNGEINDINDDPSPPAQQRGERFLPFPRDVKPGLSPPPRGMIHSAGGISPSHVMCAGGPGYAMDAVKTSTDVPTGEKMCYGLSSPRVTPCYYSQLKQLEMDKMVLERQLNQTHHLFHQQDDLRMDLLAMREEVNRLLTSLSQAQK